MPCWSTRGATTRCTTVLTTRATTRPTRCTELRYERGVSAGDGVVSVLTTRPRCLVVALTVTGWGRA